MKMVKLLIILPFVTQRSSEAFAVTPKTHAPFQLASTIGDIPSSSSSSPLDPATASDFSIQVCTSTNCSKRLQQLGLDQYHILGEIYAKAQEQNVQESMIIEDGKCQGGKNCKLGPCVAVLHNDFDGNVALEGMTSNEFTERV